MDDEWVLRNELYVRPLVEERSDSPKVPRIVRNQTIRLGAGYAGQAISAGGTAIALSGSRAYRKSPRRPLKYESVRRSDLKRHGLKPAPNTSYLPESDRRVNRWHESRLSRGKKTVPRGIIRMRMALR